MNHLELHTIAGAGRALPFGQLLDTSDSIRFRGWFPNDGEMILKRLSQMGTSFESICYLDYDDCLNLRAPQLQLSRIQDNRGDAGTVMLIDEFCDHGRNFGLFTNRFCRLDQMDPELVQILIRNRFSYILTATIDAGFQNAKIDQAFPQIPRILTKKGTDKPRAILMQILKNGFIPSHIEIYDDRMGNFPDADMRLLKKLLPNTTFTLYEVIPGTGVKSTIQKHRTYYNEGNNKK